VSDLTAFLLARLAEDENEIGPHWIEERRDEGAGPNGIGWADVGGISDVLMSSQHRALREVQAKRFIVGEHGGRDPWRVDPCDAHDPVTMATVPCDTLKALAAVYADHPDYDEAWRP
jgi:hypothetical protein